MVGIRKGSILESHTAFEVRNGERTDQGREEEREQVLNAAGLLALAATPLTAHGLLDVGELVGQVLGIIDGVVIAVVVVVVVVLVHCGRGRVDVGRG